MGNGALRYLSILIFLVSILSFGAFAATEDFQYTAFSSINACACSSLTIEGEIINTGDVTSHYLISDSGTASDWTQIVPEYFSSDDTETVFTFVNVPCDARGTYTLYTKIATSFGTQKLHTSAINVNKCNIIDVDPIDVNEDICLGDVAVYEFMLNNVGTSDEIIVPSVSDFNEYSQFSLNQYHISASSSELVYLYISAFDKEGEYSFDVSFKAKMSGYTYSVPVKYNATDCNSEPIFDDDKIPDDKSHSSLGSIIFILLIFVVAFLLLLFLLLLAIILKRHGGEKTLHKWVDFSQEDTKEIMRMRKVEERIKRKKEREAEKARKKKEKEAKKAKKRRAKEKEKQLKLKLREEEILKRERDLKKAKKEAEKEAKKKGRKQVIAEARKARPQKKVKEVKPSKSEPVDKAKLKKIFLWILLIIILLLIAGLLIWGAVVVWGVVSNNTYPGDNVTDMNITNMTDFTNIPDITNQTNETNATNVTNTTDSKGIISRISDFIAKLMGRGSSGDLGDNLSLTNESVVNDTIGADAANDSAINDTSNITGESDKSGESVNATDNETSGKITMPFVSFFTNYSSSCSFIISLALVLFVLSLLLLGLKNKEEWSEKKKQFIKYIKYVLPILFFIFLVFSFIFCVFNNQSSECWPGRCSVVRFENATNSTILQGCTNATGLINVSSAIVEKEAFPSCFCHTLFGSFIPLWLCIIILILIVVLVMLIVWILIMFSSWKKSYGSWRRKIKRRKQIKKAKALSEQKTKVKKEKDESKESVWGNIWKDILLLLILLALLLLIGFYFYSNNPFYSGNETISNVSDNDPYGVATGTYDSATGDLLIIEDVIDEDINDEVVNDSSDEGMGPVEVEPTEVEKTLIYIEENNLTDSFHYLVIESGESKEVDLGQNFVDPDGDELFFNVEGITNENVTIDIWKGVATIKAVEGFTGLVNASFDAEDPSGETVSAEMTIVVKEKEDKTLSDYLESYVSYIIIGIIIIILLIVIIVLYGKIVKEDEKKKDSKGNKKEKGFFKSF